MNSEAPASRIKPQYSAQQLANITILQLFQRIERIDNATARRIARQLWANLPHFGSLAGNFDRRERITLDDAPPPGIEAQIASISARLGLAPRLPAMFLRQPDRLHQHLIDMRNISFVSMVADGTEALNAYLAGVSPLQRLLLPPGRLRTTDDVAQFLMVNVNLLTAPHRGLTYGQRRFLLTQTPIWIMLLFVVSLLLGIFHPFQGLLMGPTAGRPSWVFATLMLNVFLCVIWGGRTLGRLDNELYAQHLLALYISFTDEFVEETASAGQAATAGPAG